VSTGCRQPHDTELTFLVPTTGNKVVVTANGVASFADLMLAVSGSDYALTFESEGLLPVTSSLFNVPIGDPSYLEFIAPPSIYYLDEPLSPQPAVRLRDLGNNLVPVTEGSINISLVYEPTWKCSSCQGPAPGLNISQPWCLPDELVMNASIYCQRVTSSQAPPRSSSFLTHDFIHHLSLSLTLLRIPPRPCFILIHFNLFQ